MINKGFGILTAFSHMADPQTLFYSVIHSEVVRQVVLVHGVVLANGAGETSLNLIKFRIFTHRVLAHVLDESSFGLQTLSTITLLIKKQQPRNMPHEIC